MAATLGVAATAVGCVPRGPLLSEPGADVVHSLLLHQATVPVHLAPAPAADKPLVLFTTGDAGWGHGEREVFRALADAGYPTVGLSAPEYLEGLDKSHRQISAVDLSADFTRVIQSAKTWLGLPRGMPVVLVGVSRGADLSVAAAGDRRLPRQTIGVIAIGLTGEEEYVRTVPGTARTDMLDLYSYLPHLGWLSLSVIQSTGDGYLPAAEARERFGPDTFGHRLIAIDAADHSFSDARDELHTALLESLSWVRTARPRPRR